MKILTTSIMAVFFTVMIVNGQELTVNTNESSIFWTGKAAFNTYELTGTIGVKSGKILLENDSIKSLEIVIDMKSLYHKNKDLRKHLKNKDFFEVKKYTTASFKLIKPVKIIEGKTTLVGKMTIKKVTEEERIPIEIIYSNDEIKLSFETTFNRTKYGVIFNSPNFFKKMKQNAIADEFLLKSDLFFN